MLVLDSEKLNYKINILFVEGTQVLGYYIKIEVGNNRQVSLTILVILVIMETDIILNRVIENYIIYVENILVDVLSS